MVERGKWLNRRTEHTSTPFVHCAIVGAVDGPSELFHILVGASGKIGKFRGAWESVRKGV